MTGLRYIEGVVTLRLERSLCNGCGLCLEVCPSGVFALAEHLALVADRDACIECGACALNCVPGAISVTPGVGCAQAIITAWLTGSEPGCEC